MTDAAQPYTAESPFFGPELEDVRTRFDEAMRAVPELCHLSHYTQADWDFTLGTVPDDGYQTMASTLIAALTRLGRTLAEAGTGALLRCVAHSDGGAVFCNTFQQGEHVVGVALDPDSRHSLRDVPTLRADMAIAELVTEVRRSVGQQGQNPGGFNIVKAPTDPLAWEPPADADGDLRSRVAAVLDPGDLQFVTLIQDGEAVLETDVFGERAAARFFRAGYTPARRRDFYRWLAPLLDSHAREIGRIVYPAIGRGLRRLTLDVQRGAIYYRKIDDCLYLVGVTLNQEGVIVADLKSEWLSRPPDSWAGR
ncbi:hypothetical protein QLQ12_36030 [Actinoplanes sp. NEAU-A12]|uniref:Uncharacterized protein n=1 Tax=Actinoplanes sandaracinus TaxID=3045177 RepID=A0ABT6WW89_9ACTN|nr:hypothetical protein [Actinoplanes sandaracinus]MDI6104013.1 hypothetical protein [Actinoplanes sandaracinus]